MLRSTSKKDFFNLSQKVDTCRWDCNEKINFNRGM